MLVVRFEDGGFFYILEDDQRESMYKGPDGKTYIHYGVGTDGPLEIIATVNTGPIPPETEVIEGPVLEEFLRNKGPFVPREEYHDGRS